MKNTVSKNNIILMHSVRMAPIRSGKKRATLRKGIRDYTLGLACIENTDDKSDFVLITITAIEVIKFNKITANIVEDEGYSNLEDLRESMLRIYPDLNDNSDVTYVSFELVTTP
jgi:hypothetical protein